MNIGVSSSCFYPDLVENSLRRVGEIGAKTAEVFFNSTCELSGSILNTLKKEKDEYGIDVRSVHPFTSAYETVMLFSSYERRTKDGIEFYKQYFNAANELGAKFVVLHGGKSVVPTTPEVYAENFMMLNSTAKEFGLYIAHENVKEHHCAKPEFMKKLADIVGDDFRMVLDIKQCRRARCNEFDFIRLLGKSIAQVHISDCTSACDCVPPGQGDYDFAKLFSALHSVGYDKSAVIELYSSDFSDIGQIVNAKTYLEKL